MQQSVSTSDGQKSIIIDSTSESNVGIFDSVVIDYIILPVNSNTYRFVSVNDGILLLYHIITKVNSRTD